MSRTIYDVVVVTGVGGRERARGLAAVLCGRFKLSVYVVDGDETASAAAHDSRRRAASSCGVVVSLPPLDEHAYVVWGVAVGAGAKTLAVGSSKACLPWADALAVDEDGVPDALADVDAPGDESWWRVKETKAAAGRPTLRCLEALEASQWSVYLAVQRLRDETDMSGGRDEMDVRLAYDAAADEVPEVPELPGECSHEEHDRMTRDAAAWARGTHRHVEWRPYGWLYGDCRRCGSGLVAKYPGSGYASAEASAEADPPRRLRVATPRVPSNLKPMRCT